MPQWSVCVDSDWCGSVANYRWSRRAPDGRRSPESAASIRDLVSGHHPRHRRPHHRRRAGAWRGAPKHPRTRPLAAHHGLDRQPLIPSPCARESDRSNRPTARTRCAGCRARGPPPAPSRTRVSSSRQRRPRPGRGAARSRRRGAYRVASRPLCVLKRRRLAVASWVWRGAGRAGSCRMRPAPVLARACRHGVCLRGAPVRDAPTPMSLRGASGL